MRRGGWRVCVGWACALIVTACAGPPAEEPVDLPTLMALPTITASLTATSTPTATATTRPTTTAQPTPTVTPTPTFITLPTATAAPTLTPPIIGAASLTPDLTLIAVAEALRLGELLPVTLPPGLTALAVVDAVIPVVQAAAASPLWMGVTGSPSAGWEVAFYDEVTDIVFTYVAALDGLLRLRRRAAFGLMPGFPLERASVTVDSDVALARAADQDSLPTGALTLTLQSAGDAPDWIIAGADLVVVIPATGG